LGANNGTQTQTEKGAAAANGVTLSGLLNVLDGFYAPANVLFVMTTNHIEVLDEALLRPGRIDYRLYLGKATDRQKIELYRRFFPEASDFKAREFVESSRSAETMAEFQGLLLGLEQGRERQELVEAAARELQ
jgi:chaperone BCS1